MDKNYVKYKNHFKVKSPHRADHLKQFQFKKGESGNPKNRVGKGNNPNSRKNLIPWEEGESGNLAGRPEGSVSLIERLKAHLRRHPEDVEAIVTQLVKLGKNPSFNQLSAISQIIDRVDGKPTEHRIIEGRLPIRIEFVPAPKQLEGKQDFIEGEVKELTLEETTGG